MNPDMDFREPSETSASNGFEIAREVIGRRKWTAILIFLGTFSAIATAVSVLPELYQSQATVLIERQQIPDDLVRSTVTSALETRLQTISQEILSRSRLEGLIARYGLYDELRVQEPMEAVIERMRQDIALELRGTGQRGQSATVAFTIGYRGRDSQKVAAVTNTLASFYVEENLKVREEQASGTSEFLKVQLEDMQETLEAMERRVGRFKEEHIGELPHQQDANLASLEQLNTRLQINRDNQLRVTERLTQLREQLIEAESLLSVDGPDATAQKITQLRNELRELRKRFSDRYPDVVRVKAEISALVERLREQQADEAQGQLAVQINPQVVELRSTVNDAEVELKALKAEEENLKNSIDTFQSRVELAPLMEQQYQVLMRDYETTAELYRSLLLRQKEAELAESMEQRQKGEQFRVIEAALPSERPAAPNRVRLLIMGLALAIGLALGLVVVSEQLDTTFHTVDALRGGAKVPILASIPRIVTTRDKRREIWRFGLAVLTAAIGLVLIVATSYFIANGNERLVGLLM